jgi:Meckel syndrome type 1 protein
MGDGMQMHDTELSQAYREAKHPEPSAALDARILAAAQAAVAPQRRRPAWFGWAVPLSTTAVLVLGISLLFRMQLEAPETLREDMPPLPALESAPSSATSASDVPADRSVAPAATAQAIAEGKTDQTSAAPKPSSAPTVAAAAPESAAHAAAVSSVASAPAAVEERAAIAPMLPPRSSPVADSVTAPAPVSAPVPAAAAGASLAREYAIRAEKESATKAVSLSSEPASAARLKQGMSRMQAATLLMESPEQWVESVRKLLREGQIEVARTRLQELRKRFPDFPLPPDLEPSRCCPLPPASTE